MPFAIDLSPRQSVRTLEQAIRHHAEVLLEPRTWTNLEPITCRIERATPQSAHDLPPSKTILLSCDLNEIGDAWRSLSNAPHQQDGVLDTFNRLVGTYCDMAIRLGQQVYLCSADVVKVEPPAPHNATIRIHLTRPDAIQVGQRRRFRRVRLADSTKVRLSWGPKAEEGIGWLCNISPEGLACRVEAQVADHLWIGDKLHTELTLTPTDTQPFVFQAVICNKTPAGTEGKMIVGMQFFIDTNDAATLKAIETLRQKLWDRNTLSSPRRDEEKQ